MPEISITVRAEEDLLAIWAYIGPENERAAYNLLQRINKKIQTLLDFPDIGRQRDDIRSGIRMLIESRYVVLYEYHIDNDVIEIVTVIDGRRDLKTWLAS